MTVEMMKEAFERVSRNREEMLSNYKEVMNKYFPQLMCSPYERFVNDHKELFDMFKVDSRQVWEDYLHGYSEYVTFQNDYDDDFRDPQTGQFYNYFSYEMLYSYKTAIPEADFIRCFYRVMSAYCILKEHIENPYADDTYCDSAILTFNNEDVLITDPCYILIDDDEHDSNWRDCNCGYDFEVLGIDKYVTKRTLYGDWGCTVWNKDTKEEIGSFCADAGLVSVFSLDQVKKYNPDIEEWCKEHNWCATILRNFTGIVQIKTGFQDSRPEEYEFYRYVEGEGSINFYGGQTSL